MRPILTHPTYSQLHQGVADIALQYTRQQYEPDFIIGLTRGGLIPAVMLSHMTNNTPVVPINYSSTRGNGDNRNHINNLNDFNGQHDILVIDDICDTGRTLLEVKEYYVSQGQRIRTAALYYKENDVFKPDYYWQYVPSDGPWIIFPFEN